MFKYFGPSLKGLSRKDTLLNRTQILGSKYFECIEGPYLSNKGRISWQERCPY